MSGSVTFTFFSSSSTTSVLDANVSSLLAALPGRDDAVDVTVLVLGT